MSNRFAGEEGEIEFVTKKPEEKSIDDMGTVEMLKAVGKGVDEGYADFKREFSQRERDQAAERHQALPDGSYPIKNREDLSNAIQAFGRAKDKARAKAHIKRRARALGCTDMLPEGW